MFSTKVSFSPITSISLLIIVTFVFAETTTSHGSNVKRQVLKNPMITYVINAYVQKLRVELQTNDNVSPPCRQAIDVYSRDLENYQPWALTMLDSSGKIPSGLTTGNLQSLGAFDECINIEANNFTDVNYNETISGSYCTMFIVPDNVDTKTMEVSNPEDDSEISRFVMDIMDKRVGLLPPSIGLCFPSHCSASDLSAASKISVAKTWPITLQGSCYTKSETTFKPYEIVIFVVWSIFGLVLVAGTVVEALIKFKKLDEANTATKVLVSFSVYKNSIKLFDSRTSKDSIDCLYGFRFIGMCFVIIGHTYAFAAMLPLVNSTEIKHLFGQFWFQLVLNATPWVDSFFLMSGMLVGYIGIKEYKKLRNTSEVSGNSLPQTVWFYSSSILASYFHRYIRLTPGLLMVATAYMVWGSLGSGPFWSVVKARISDNCVDNWWANVLYINNFVTNNQMCMGITWYIANDFQFYLISPVILLLVTSRKPVLGLIANMGFVIISIVSTAIIVGVNNYAPTILAGNIGSQRGGMFDAIYIKPYCRIGTYSIGIFLGYAFIKYRDLKISKMINIVLWTVSVFLLGVITFSTQKWNKGEAYNSVESAFYSALHRPVWSLCWGYILFACGTGNGGVVNDFLSWKPFIPLGRLTYQAFLIHYLIIFNYIGFNRTPIFFSHANMIQLFLAFLTITYLLSYVLALAFEIPIISLEKMVFANRGKPQSNVTLRQGVINIIDANGISQFDKKTEIHGNVNNGFVKDVAL